MQITALYLVLLGFAVLTVIYFLSGSPSSPGIAPNHQGSSSQPSSKEKFHSLLQQTTQLIHDHKLVEAEAKLADMQALQPNNLVILSHTAAIATQRKDYAKARELYQALLKESPNNYVANYNLAEIEFVTHHFPEAERRFQELVRTRPLDDNLLFQLFLCAHLQNHFREAEEIARQFSPTGLSPVWHYANALLYRQEKKTRQADELLVLAKVLYPDKAQFYDATCASLGLLEPASPSPVK